MDVATVGFEKSSGDGVRVDHCLVDEDGVCYYLMLKMRMEQWMVQKTRKQSQGQQRVKHDDGVEDASPVKLAVGVLKLVVVQQEVGADLMSLV